MDGGALPGAGVDLECVEDPLLEGGAASDDVDGRAVEGGEGDLADAVEFLERAAWGEVLLVEVGVTYVRLREGLGQECFDDTCEHADGDVAAHAGFGPVPDRAQVEEDLEHPK